MPVPRLEPLEMHSAFVYGPRRGHRAGEGPPLTGSPREVLAVVLAEALAEPPCFVAFSGGRDSSAILAAAVHTARREGLAEPIALTGVYEDLAATREDQWQRLVIDHLRVEEWRRHEGGSDFDALGEVGREALTRHGPFWPPNAYGMTLVAREAGGGTLLTGGGGDELLSPWDWRRPTLAQLRQVRPPSRLLKLAAFTAAPLRVRQSVGTNRAPGARLGWLHDDVLASLNLLVKRSDVPEPSWQEDLEAYIEGRYRELVMGTVGQMAADEGVRLVEPLYDARVIRAVGRSAPRNGFTSRSAAFEQLFGDLLPEAMIKRPSKARFDSAIWGPETRAFTRDWDGGGVDPSYADFPALRAEWSKEAPHAGSLAPLQLAWLASPAGQLARASS